MAIEDLLDGLGVKVGGRVHGCTTAIDGLTYGRE
jgi:hypothetical protein